MKLLITLFLLLPAFSVLANTKYAGPVDSTASIIDKSAAILLIDKGKQMVIDRNYRDALLTFREAAFKDPYTWKAPYWISFCHYKLNNYGYAKQYGLSAIIKGGSDVDKEVYDILGNSYHRLSMLDSAQYFYQKAINEMPNNRLKELNIETKIAECAFAKTALEKETLQRVAMKGEINSGFNDYCPLLSADGKTFYFTSRRGNTTGGQLNPDDQEYYEDVYKAMWNAETNTWDSITNDIERMNTDGFDALNWLSKDGLQGVLTVNITYGDSKLITKSSDICEIGMTKQNKWSSAKPIANKTINTSFMEGSATLTADGNTMYFVSDRKGDKRSTDIYMVQKSGKKWGSAVLLSDSINSVGRETTPFITADGRFLFFSSDGHRGMGGLDVYVCENTGSGWSSPINLGASINTVNDDTHFKIFKEANKIYMSGINLSGQKSSYDIYEIDLSKVKLPVKI
jgi:tetratricopeptide (TPR) repeat protein